MGILMETTEVNTASYQSHSIEVELFGAMETPREYYTDTVHTIAVNTRETEFGSLVEPIPITLKTYKPYPPTGHPLNGYRFTQEIINSFAAAPCVFEDESSSPAPVYTPNLVQNESNHTSKVSRAPPKKKWIKEYLEEEPKSEISVRVIPVSAAVIPCRSNGVLHRVTPPPPVPVVQPQLAVEHSTAPLLHLDYMEHSRPRAIHNPNSSSQIPSPPSVSSSGSGSGSSGSGSGSAPRAGTREVHNKLEKNRRAHLKECFELLKKQLPTTSDDRKTSNLSILGSAIRYIQMLRRKERECEHEMERLAREKIAAQQKLAALKRELSVRVNASALPRTIDTENDEKGLNGHILGIPLSTTSTRTQTMPQIEASPPRTLNRSTKLRALPIQLSTTTSQLVRTSHGARHNTVTLTAVDTLNGHILDNGLSNALSSTIVHPAHIHLPISQVVGNGGLVVSPAALQLLSASGGLRVLQAPTVQTNGMSSDKSVITRDNGIVSPTPSSSDGGTVVVNGLTPLVVSSQSGAHLLQAHTLTHKMVETQVMKGSVAPLTVSTQYLSATTIVKPVVVVSSAHTPSTNGS